MTDRQSLPTKRNNRRRSIRSGVRPALDCLELRLAPATLPAGFTEAVIATGIAEPTAMEIAPDGRIFVAQQGGDLRVIQNGSLLPTPFVSLNVDSFFERGLLGVTFDPNFATNQFVYVYYTTASEPVHNRVSRFTANGNVAVPGSEFVLMDLENLDAGNHNGGAIHFGTDGKLYVGVGENAVPSNSQTLNNRLGKMLRINSDGSIPNDNPFFNQASGVNRAIWARGLRNPFTFAVQPVTGRIFINDVGQTSREEIDDGIAGANYGWPNCEGDCSPANQNFRDPLFQYNHGSSNTEGCAITGGTFYNPTTAQFPADYLGDYFFADLCNGWVRKYDPASDTATGFATDLPDAPVDLKVDGAGNLYYLTRGFGSNTGQLTRVQFPAGQTAPSVTQHPANQRVAVGQMAVFSVSASGSVPLSFQWQRDGVDIPGATGTSFTIISAALADDGARFRAGVMNGQGTATSNEATLTVVNNQPPTPVITSPDDGTRYNAGDTINFAGTGTDPEDGMLPASAFTWQVDFHHADHLHPFRPPQSGVTGGSFQIPTVGETSADVFFRILLTVTDSFGITGSTFRDIAPNTSMITLASSLPGLQVTMDDQPVTTPISVTGVVGMRRTIGFVSPQVFAGVFHRFVNWQHGGTARQEIATPAADTTFTAMHTVIGSPLITDLRILTTPERQVVLSFSNPLNEATAENPANYRLDSAGRDRRFNVPAMPSGDDKPLRLATPVYEQGVDPVTAAIASMVTIDILSGFHKNTFYQLTVDGTATVESPNAVASLNPNLLDGEFAMRFPTGNGVAGGNFVGLIGAGRRFTFPDRAGDRVFIELSNRGQIELVRESPAVDGVQSEGVSLRVTGTSGRSSLTGRVTNGNQPATTTFSSAAGLVGLENNLQNNPSFVIGTVSAVIVDRLLDADGINLEPLGNLFGGTIRRDGRRR